jgi:hypothetical protein
MKKNPLIQKNVGHTRSTKRVLKAENAFGDIVRLEAQVANRVKSKKARRNTKSRTHKAVSPQFFEDSGHVRLTKKR